MGSGNTSSNGRRRSLKIVIGSGPTRERIDPVRFISNYSTGYMGAQLAAQAAARGHKVTVVSGPSSEPLPPTVRRVSVEQADQMEHALRRHARCADAVIMVAAVSDFRAAKQSSVKIPRAASLTLKLRATPDIIGRLPRRSRQIVAGFALESGHAIKFAKRKLLAKRLDLLVAQNASGETPFGRRAVRAWLLTNETLKFSASRSRVCAKIEPLGRTSKPRLARLLLDKIEALWYGQLVDGGRQKRTRKATC